jgi:lipoprotein-releasing system ATP-binding protein
MNDAATNQGTANEVVLSAQQLKKRFKEGRNVLTVLEDINLELRQGDMLAVTGASGCGKSTLLNLLAGLDVATSGEVRLCGQSLARLSERRLCQLRNCHLGFVFQFHHLLPEFTALENAAIPLLLAGKSPREARNQARELLEHIGLGQRLRHKPGQLSGGERQRVAIARALVTKPDLVLADEPTGNLDEKTADEVQQLLLRLNAELGTALLVVTHDANFSRQCKRAMRLHEGRLMSV